MDLDTRRRLIELIKNHAVLFNTTLPEYKDTASRSEAWTEIAAEMDMTVQNCKMEWMKLRNSYVNALRRRVAVQNRDGRVLPPWVFEPELGFLKPFMTGRGFDDTPYTVLLPSPTYTLEHNVNDPIEEFTINLSKKRKKKLKSPKLEPEDSTYEIQEHPERSSTTQDIINVMDEADLFFLGLSQTFKTLPKLEQCRLKMDIFKIVNDAELRHIENRKRKSKRRSISSTE